MKTPALRPQADVSHPIAKPSAFKSLLSPLWRAWWVFNVFLLVAFPAWITNDTAEKEQGSK